MQKGQYCCEHLHFDLIVLARHSSLDSNAALDSILCNRLHSKNPPSKTKCSPIDTGEQRGIPSKGVSPNSSSTREKRGHC